MDSSSKVTVEYHDPTGLFPLLSREIQSRLPLRHLNWRSLNRPLRQIKSLHLDFVPDSFTKRSQQLAAPQNNTARSSSFEIIANGGGHKNAAKERRHQIPGLQTSPYLKIYLLRCDDKATYKESERAKVREWIRQGTASKKKGNHDAFEWLILHVVVPDTLAASEPRWKEAVAEDSEDLRERPKQGAKWPGKSTRTVFDKLRADFNESGKSGQDRVAQIRLPKDQFPVDLLPTPAVAATLKESPEEREKAWNDFITKIRTLILDPFDKRVKQYEADIAEQDSRRSMPGFNFCTFFIYKEGLAKALESIGLIEDALVIYDELAVGLETVLRDIANGRAEGTATTFAPHTDDIVERIIKTRNPLSNGLTSSSVEYGSGPKIDALEDDYREKIVRSSISVFDFFSYLFSCQKTILLRLANAKAARLQLGLSPKDGSEDLILISEVCWRAASFIHNNARILKQDLLNQKTEQSRVELSDADIESVIYAWTYEAAGKVLEETASFALDHLPEPGERETIVNGHAAGPKAASRGSLHISAHPQRSSSLRTTSLPPKKTKLSRLENKSSLQSASENDLMNRPLSAGTGDNKHPQSQPGFAELVTYRASLVMMQRKALEVLAKQRGWIAGWASLRKRHSDRLDEVPLDGDSNDDVSDSIELRQQTSNLITPALSSSLASKTEFFAAYEQLSDRAMRYYVASTQAKSAETIIGDLAILKYQQGEFGYAVSFFQHVLPLYAEDGWSVMEAEALKLHAKCLKELGRNEEYAKTSLLLLSKVCASKRGRKELVSQYDASDDEMAEFDHLLSELVTFSREMGTELLSPADQFFSDIRFDQEIKHPEYRDGFALRLHFRHLVDESVTLDHVRVRLTNAEDSNQGILLSNNEAVTIYPGMNEVELWSNTVAFGPYFVNRIVLEAGNLLFEHDFQPEPEISPISRAIDHDDDSTTSTSDSKQPWVFLYPAEEAFNADVSLTPDVQLDSSRYLEIRLSSGWNDIEGMDLKFKPGTAGLRLYLADAKSNDIDRPQEEEVEATPGHLTLGLLKPNSTALIRMPYSLEQQGQPIVIRLEAQYHTSQGSFLFVESFKLETILPLDVNVHDIFQYDALFSSFVVRTTTPSPLCVTYANLQSSAKYEVTGPPALSVPMPVFEGQIVKLLYKITQRSDASSTGKSALSLKLTYHLVDEALVKTLLGKFSEALGASPFAHLWRMLSTVLVSTLKTFWSPMDVHMALLQHSGKVPTFDQVGWAEVIPTLPGRVQPQLEAWLRRWHEDNTIVIFGADTASVGCLRSVIISVEVPSVDVVHKASLTLMTRDDHLKRYPPILNLGEAVTARLRIKSTNRWGNKMKSAVGERDKAVRYVFEVHADQDSWLVGGQRRGHFRFESEKEVELELLLIPLKADILSLPQVDVQPDAKTGDAEIGSPNRSHMQTLPSISSETHCESAGEAVQVIRNSKSSRIHIPEGMPLPPPPTPPSRSSLTSKGRDLG